MTTTSDRHSNFQQLMFMPSSFIRNPAGPDEDFKAQQELEFDRYRTAIKIVQRMREAELVANYLMVSKTATDAFFLYGG